MGVGQCGRHGDGTRCSATRCGVRSSQRGPIGAASLALATLLLAESACATDVLPRVCPDIAAGQLVITELRGNVGNDLGASSSSTDGTSSTGADTSTTASGSSGDESSGDGGSDTADASVGLAVYAEDTSTTSEPTPADQGRDWIEIRNVGDGTIDLNGLVIRNAAQDGSGEVLMRVRYHRELEPGEAYVLGLVFDYERPLHIDYGVGDAKGTDNLLDSGRVELSSCDTSIDLVVYDDLPTDGTWSFGGEPPDAEDNNDAERWCIDAGFSVIGDAIEPGTPGDPNSPCD
jgi:hypothetical protein